MCADHADMSFGQSKLYPFSEMYNEKACLRAQRVLEEKRSIAEKKQHERREAAREARFFAIQMKLTEIQRANRAMEDRMQRAKLLQNDELQARENRLKTVLHKIDEASDRRGSILAFHRLRTAENLLTNSQRAQRNRFAAEMEVQAKQYREEERENARQRVASTDKITRGTMLQQRGQLRDQRIFGCVKYRIQQELANREKAIERERARDERLWRLTLERKTGGFGRSRCPQKGDCISSALL
ncbi:hypothetical protein TraAM80_09866 [Trypanosoma rangeli]|uniref:Uncharacterized protein n=1 Tax=Trypanosoma rangeli TaxID=5698 RepID=A0A3R7JVY3_TRYRA|nr:uncharacterized protein TraAM80_09866 [Trypanosoma rangeli]RNE96300.1 hypothetical protein TraAM80_09866 [Trypanosoma rangeli]|eukprot:RNE96300.1 hypothetical protein TraAM80_09866 [Trypanosoma rangeli]